MIRIDLPACIQNVELRAIRQGDIADGGENLVRVHVGGALSRTADALGGTLRLHVRDDLAALLKEAQERGDAVSIVVEVKERAQRVGFSRVEDVPQ